MFISETGTESRLKLVGASTGFSAVILCEQEQIKTAMIAAKNIPILFIVIEETHAMV
jgi:hypothetical protein